MTPLSSNIIEGLNEYDNAFYKSKDAICERCVKYAKENKTFFKLQEITLVSTSTMMFAFFSYDIFFSFP